MPDHFHWLFQLKEDASLSRCVNNVKSRFSRLINEALGMSGRLWQKGFYDRAIRNYPLWDAKWL
jgi:REP element-mobilizing transposase RayT